MAAPSSVSTGRRVCADAARPLRRGPPAERGRAVALYRYGCWRRGHPTPVPACQQRGGLLIGGTVPFCPPAPARPISASACLVSWRYRPAFPSAVPHPFSCFRSVSVGGSVGGSVATGDLSAVRSFLPARRAPPDQCSGVLRYSGGTDRSSAAAVPARSVLSFGLLSAAVGRRGFRSARKASLRTARNRSKSFLACVELARSVVPVHPIDRCTCVANFTAGACARASRRLTPPLSDGGQRNIYGYLTANQFDTKETVSCDNLTFYRCDQSVPTTCLRRGRRLAPPAPFVYICDISSWRPDVPAPISLETSILWLSSHLRPSAMVKSRQVCLPIAALEGVRLHRSVSSLIRATRPVSKSSVNSSGRHLTFLVFWRFSLMRPAKSPNMALPETTFLKPTL